MKVQIRRGVFETNSSSVHSVSVCSKTDYDRWINNEIKYNPYKDNFLVNEEADKYNVENFDKNKYYWANIDIFTDEDLKIPVIIEILKAWELSESGYVDAYISYDRFFKASEIWVTDYYEKIENIYEDKVEFGYTGRN